MITVHLIIMVWELRCKSNIQLNLNWVTYNFISNLTRSSTQPAASLIALPAAPLFPCQLNKFPPCIASRFSTKFAWLAFAFNSANVVFLCCSYFFLSSGLKTAPCDLFVLTLTRSDYSQDFSTRNMISFNQFYQ